MDATATVPTAQLPALDVIKAVTSVGPYDSVGDVITYSITATNTGNQTLTGVTITDPGAGVVLGPCTPSIPATLAPTASVACVATHAVTQQDIDAGEYANVAFADSNQTPPDSDSETVPVSQTPALTVLKTETSVRPYQSVGQVISYSITVTNTGNADVDRRHGHGSWRRCSARPVHPAIPATVAPGKAVVCTATHTVTQADLDAGEYSNTAQADSDQTPSDSDVANVPLLGNPALTLVKSATPSTYDAVGQVITYSYTVTNTGNVTLPGPFSVTDDKLRDRRVSGDRVARPGRVDHLHGEPHHHPGRHRRRVDRERRVRLEWGGDVGAGYRDGNGGPDESDDGQEVVPDDEPVGAGDRELFVSGHEQRQRDVDGDQLWSTTTTTTTSPARARLWRPRPR